MSLNLWYSFREGVVGLHRARLATAITVSTVAITLTLWGIFLVLTVNVRRVVELFKERMPGTMVTGDPDFFLRHNYDMRLGCWDEWSIGHYTSHGGRVNPRERLPCLSSPEFRMRAIRRMLVNTPRPSRNGARISRAT